MFKKHISWMLLLTLIISMFSFSYGETSQKLVILHTNDTHSRVSESSNDGMGFAKIAAEVSAFKAQNPNVLLVDAGDTLHGQTFATLNKGENIVQLMNMMKYDAMTPGNHDFNYGYEQLTTLSKKMAFPLLSANVKKADGTTLYTPYVIKEIGGIKVAIFGLSTPETAYMTHPNNVVGLTFADPIAEAKATVAQLKGKADVVVCLSHLGLNETSEFTSKRLAQEVDGIDVIVDGHSHTTLAEGLKVGNTIIGQTGEYDKNLGVIELTVSSGKVTSSKASHVTKAQAAEITPDQSVSDLIAQLSEANKVITDVVIGKTSVALKGERAMVRAGETNLGNLITAAMLDVSGADVALTNGGGIRASIDAGDITKGEVITVLPFGNYVVVKSVTGQELKDALELGVSKYPEANGAFPHVGGITFTFDAGKAAGSRVTAVAVNGKPLDLSKSYTLATNDFMAAGGDGYTMFADNKIQGEYPALDEVLISYIAKSPAVSPVVDGRVKAIPAPAKPEIPAEPAVPTVAAPSAQSYTVKADDVLWKIARQFNLDWQALAKFNNLSNPNVILPGQILLIPAH